MHNKLNAVEIMQILFPEMSYWDIHRFLHPEATWIWDWLEEMEGELGVKEG